jgi:hypothetical protein
VSDVLPAIFGLVGAVLGATASAAVTYLNIRGAREQERRARRDRVTDLRREACVSFLTAAESFLDLARALTAELDSSGSTERPEDLHLRYSEAWASFTATSAAVQIAGPAELADVGRRLRKAIGDYSDIVDGRYDAGRWPRCHDDALEAARERRNEFVSAAQRLLAD